MNADERKKEILNILKEQEEPVTGAELAKRFHVTRQIIVQDVALLRAEGVHIISTARGYLLEKMIFPEQFMAKRRVTVCHSADKIEEELQIVVDLGGHVLTTAVNHPVYGNLGESLNIKSRKDITRFLARIQETGCEPLLALTKGVHCHMISAESEEALDEICQALKVAGYLISDE